jgi:hypothetical protein
MESQSVTHAEWTSAQTESRADRSGMIRLVAGAPLRRHVLTLSSTNLGLRAYVFTFGP